MESSDVSVDEALKLIEAGALLLDVREQDEWDRGHAPQATLIPLSQLQARATELPQDRTIVCVCHVGGRSAMVTQALNQGGWSVVNLLGGMAAWQTEGHPVLDSAGKPGEAR